MCTGAVSLGSQAFGVGMSTVGSFMGAGMQQDALRSQARIADINASIADAAARSTLQASERQQESIKLKGEQVKSSQRAAEAANGIDVGVGTPVDLATSTDYVTEVDANTARANGIAAAWGQRIQAGNYRAEANSDRASASGISPFLAGASTLITGAGQVASSWYNLNKVGALGSGSAGSATPGGFASRDSATYSWYNPTGRSMW